MIELPTLFPHQEDLRDRTRESLTKHGRVILCAQTGVGKTRTAKWILGACSQRRDLKDTQSGRCLFVVHRRGLVQNAIDSFLEAPELPHGIIMSGCETTWGQRVQVASIDTILSWFIEDGKWKTDYTWDLIVWDEAHSHHPKFAKLLKYHDAQRKKMGLHPAFVIGLTATPQANGLADIYREIVQGPSTQWLIDNNYLSPFRYFRATQGRLDRLKMRGGEFTNESVCDAMAGLSGDLVRDWKKFADGRPTVGFFPRRTHAQEAMEQLRAAGLRVEYVDANTSDDMRKVIFQQLNEHRIDYLANVQIVERGTDIPAIACVQLCVAVGSVARYRQMIGRGSRVHPSKADCLVLDHGGNIKRHGFFEDDPLWSLDYTKTKDGEVGPRPTIECPNCDAIYRGGKCRNCGYEPTPKERRAAGLEFDGTELKEIKRTERKEPKWQSAEDLMVRALFMAGKSGRTWRQAVGIFNKLAQKQGTRYRVPKTVKIGHCEYRTVPYNSADATRRVSTLYPKTNGGSFEGPYAIH